MKSSWLFTISRLCLLALLAIPVRLAPQEQSADAEQEQRPKRIRYIVTDLGTLPGGPFSLAIGVNNHGLLNGASGLPDGTQHAVLWYRGSIIDIGTPGLGGPNSGAFGVNERSQASGLAETSNSDPNGEDFCGFGTHLICLGFVWQNGLITPLSTLGGNNSEAGQINNRGKVAGNAENTTPDSTCPAGGPQVFQEKPVVWENGQIEELPTFPGDPDGWAFGINDNGQVVGASGSCSALNPDTGVYVLSRHALLWEKGEAIALANLGGTGAFGPGNIAGEINNQGQVVGTSDLAGDTTFHGYLWTKKTGIQDLGTLAGDFASAALGINDRGEVVGVSFDASFNPRAFLRQNGVMTDLNTLVPANSPLFLLFAHGINSRGEIVGFGVSSSGEVHAFLATPRECEVGGESAEPAPQSATGENATIALPENARKLLQQRVPFGRFGIRPIGPQ